MDNCFLWVYIGLCDNEGVMNIHYLLGFTLGLLEGSLRAYYSGFLIYIYIYTCCNLLKRGFKHTQPYDKQFIKQRYFHFRLFKSPFYFEHAIVFVLVLFQIAVIIFHCRYSGSSGFFLRGVFTAFTYFTSFRSFINRNIIFQQLLGLNALLHYS